MGKGFSIGFPFRTLKDARTRVKVERRMGNIPKITKIPKKRQHAGFKFMVKIKL